MDASHVNAPEGTGEALEVGIGVGVWGTYIATGLEIGRTVVMAVFSPPIKP
jgi:hypothetical protein